MRIGILSPPFFAVPPLGYGGVQTHIHHLIGGLQNLGHEVVLFASEDSNSWNSESRYWYATASKNVSGKTVPELTQVIAAYRSLTDVDIIHDHTFIGPQIAGSLSKIPVVTTLHDIANRDRRLIYSNLDASIGTIAISDYQAQSMKPVNIERVILPGLSPDHYDSSSAAGYLLWIGRFSAEKGACLAIKAARQVRTKIILAGRIVRGQEEYFEKEIEPLFCDDVIYAGELDLAGKRKLLSGAQALLNAVVYEEPFGLINIEALMSGTPVITLNRGAMSEIVKHGETGFICNTGQEVIDAVVNLKMLNREKCRADAEARFSANRMAKEHLDYYESRINQ